MHDAISRVAASVWIDQVRFLRTRRVGAGLAGSAFLAGPVAFRLLGTGSGTEADASVLLFMEPAVVEVARDMAADAVVGAEAAAVVAGVALVAGDIFRAALARVLFALSTIPAIARVVREVAVVA